MAVVADVHADAGVLRLKNRVAEVSGCEVKLFPEPGMNVWNVMLAILAQILAVRVDYCCGVEIQARHFFFVN